MGRTKCCPTYGQIGNLRNEEKTAVKFAFLVAENAKESEQGPEAVPYDYEEEIAAQGPVIMPAPQVRAFNIKQWFSDLFSESGKFDWSYGPIYP